MGEKETAVALLRLTLGSRSLLRAPYKNRSFHELVKNTLKTSHLNKGNVNGTKLRCLGKSNSFERRVRKQIKGWLMAGLSSDATACHFFYLF